MKRTIDDKLKEIVEGCFFRAIHPPYDTPDIDKRVVQIKQAFADEGYIKEIDVSVPAITPYKPITKSYIFAENRLRAEQRLRKEQRLKQKEV